MHRERERKREKMLKRAFCSVVNLFVIIMLQSKLVSCQLPGDQVSAMTSVYEIIQNNTAASSFVWKNVLKTSNPCSWKGVGCTSDNSSINTISFQHFFLSTSEFLPYLCNISTLESPDVSNNQLRSIPDGFFTGCGEISGLKFIDFSGNRLNGPLPSFNNGFRMLEKLDFSRNYLSGEISLQLDGLNSLKTLYLSNNQFRGKIPTSLGKMNLLEELHLSGNSFRGEIPLEITKYKNLRVIVLSANRLSGSIPRELGELSGLNNLQLSGNSLSGEIPKELGDLPMLEYLSLSNNNLSGGIPASLSNITALEYLELQDNKLGGPIPDSIRNLSSLIKLQIGNNQLNGRIPDMPWYTTVINLSNNLLVGRIPFSLSTLRALTVLDLSNNRLSGKIPASLAEITTLTQLLLMNNDLSGVVPTFRNEIEVDTRGNKDLIDPRLPRENSSPVKRNSSIDSDFVIVGVASGFPLGLLISVIAIFISRRYYNSIHGNLSTPNTIHRQNVDFKKGMEAAADPSNIILKTPFSTFYKAIMPSDATYLVKKVNHSRNIFNFPRHKQLVEELELLGSLSNPNVMIPVSYVLTPRRAYLFYDFVRGTLHDIFHHPKGNSTLDWARRYNIAVGVARGLAFLHECSSGPIILLDLSTKTILLKSIDESQISDIELCEVIHPSTRATSAGYVAPEYGCTGRVTGAGNVYSFGVVLLELLTGKAAVSEGTELAKWVLSISNYDQILDSNVSERETSTVVRNQMISVLEVALACINVSPQMRPNMIHVVQMLLSRR